MPRPAAKTTDSFRDDLDQRHRWVLSALDAYRSADAELTASANKLDEAREEHIKAQDAHTDAVGHRASRRQALVKELRRARRAFDADINAFISGDGR